MTENEATTGMPSNRKKILFVSLGLACLAVLLLYVYNKQLQTKYGVAGDKMGVVAAKYSWRGSSGFKRSPE